MDDKKRVAELEEQQYQEKEGYKELLEMFVNAPMDLDSYFEASQKALTRLADALSVGMVRATIDVAENLIMPKGQRWSKIIYMHVQGYEEEESYSETYNTYEGGIGKYEFFSRKGCAFTEESRQEIHHLALLLFGFGGRARMAEILTHVLTHDIATGVPNLATFIHHAIRLSKENKICAYDAYFMNTKNFKYINKIVRYQQGDKVMAQYANKLQMYLEGEEMLARLGGDNYVALVRKDRSMAFQRFISGVELDIDTDNGMRRVVLGAVAGVYVIDKEINNVADIMIPLSTALQAAKQVAHEDIVYYSQELAQRILENQKVLLDFERALNAGEFVAYLQPKIRIEGETICGAEALVRWIHEGRMIPPGEFIPALEKDGTICKLDFEVLRQVCLLVKKWVSEGKNPGKISVNFSRWNLKNSKLVADVMQMLSEYDVNPKYIEVELTETMDFEEYTIMQKLSEQFKRNGVSTSIDDFGTGYSSLNLLKNIDVEVLKIDRSFISAIGEENEGKKDRFLLTSIIDMAKSLDMQVLAEGVETEEQKRFLAETSCDMIQGFYYSKPLPADEFEKLAYS